MAYKTVLFILLFFDWLLLLFINASSAAASIWWAGVQPKLARLSNLAVWQLPADQSQALARLAARSMTLQVTVQEGQVWVGDAHTSVEIHPVPLMTPAA